MIEPEKYQVALFGFFVVSLIGIVYSILNLFGYIFGSEYVTYGLFIISLSFLIYGLHPWVEF
jgi:hypothetical protein